ncbi:MAG TPA: FAD-dependent oxidoreductase [Paenirhodobacter sp.]
MKESDPITPLFRQSAWAKLTQIDSPEVLILGGGVNGVGLLRDLSLNGVTAVLLETGDFAAGASSASSRMAHGGLRYLEGREFKLVAESARERNMLLHDAAHLVKPLETVVPVKAWIRGLPQTILRFVGLSKKAAPFSVAALKSGLIVYERFGAIRRALPRHRVLISRGQFPAGLPADTRAVVSYYDGQITGPERLLFEMLDDAATRPGIAALNHIGWTVDETGLFRVTDPASGETHALRPQIIVNATGAAIDRVNAELGLETRFVRGVKGAHLALRHPQLFTRMNGRAFYFDDGQGRMVICLPVGEIILIGTTEIEVRDPTDHSVAGAEIDYLLTALNSLFSDIHVDRSHIAAVTSGIRPLQASDGNATQAARDHALRRSDRGGIAVLSLVGGKWTTFRAFAEQTTDAILAHLGKVRGQSTAGRPYPGANPPEAAVLARETGLSLSRAEELTARYGAVGAVIGAYCAAADDAPLQHAPGYSRREIVWLVDRRLASTLEDLVLRRTGVVMTGRMNRAALQEIAGIMAQTLGCGPEWIATHVESCAADPRILWE